MATEDSPLIAIVDDDRPVRMAISSVMRSAGFRTQTFDSAEAFLDAGTLQQKACVILDVHMPGWSGLELQRHLMKTAAPPPIVFVSGRTSGETLAMRNGAAAFLTKPFSADELLQAVQRALQ